MDLPFAHPGFLAAVRAASRTRHGWRHSERMVKDALTAAQPHLELADLPADLVATIRAQTLREAADVIEAPLLEAEPRGPQWSAGRRTAVSLLRRLADEADQGRNAELDERPSSTPVPQADEA